jgi:hypothetical protein
MSEEYKIGRKDAWFVPHLRVSQASVKAEQATECLNEVRENLLDWELKETTLYETIRAAMLDLADAGRKMEEVRKAMTEMAREEAE